MSAIEAAGTRLPIYQGVTLPRLRGGLRGVPRQHFTSCFALSFGMSLYFLLSVDYCQFLLAIIHTNYTQTCFAEHTHKWSHDQINRYLRNETISQDKCGTMSKMTSAFQTMGICCLIIPSSTRVIRPKLNPLDANTVAMPGALSKVLASSRWCMSIQIVMRTVYIRTLY